VRGGVTVRLAGGVQVMHRLRGRRKCKCRRGRNAWFLRTEDDG